jgi:gliding motility-associated-like protein
MRFYCLVFILLYISVIKINAQGSSCPPSNIGFESGNFGNWSCDTGFVDPLGVVQVIQSPPVINRQTLYNTITVPQVDPFGGFPTLCPYGGKYSIRLGNQQNGKGAERVSYTFTVPAGDDSYDLIFYYAVVLQNPPHQSFQQPRFTVKTFDVTDNTSVDCASFDFIASSNLPGFKLAPTGDTVYYKDWSPSTLHLKGYAGKKIRLEFTTNDCTLGRHFGYAYLDVNEDCGSPITGNSYCANENSVTLFAPAGFGNYQWYSGDLSTQLNPGPALTISPPPADGTKYAVVLTPFANLGCTDTLYTIVNKNDANFVFKVADTLYGCVGTGVDLTAPLTTAGSSNGLALSYFTDPFGFNYLYKPESILKSGTYYVKAVTPQSCTTILPVHVVVANPTLAVTDPAPVDYPTTVDLSATFTHYRNNTYAYYKDNTTNSVVTDYQHIGYGGTYYIKATNATGCVTIMPVTVTIVPPPPPILKAANTFTPNNDGINDYFYLTIIGFETFKSLRIYNRYGQLMFETRSPGIPWDGKYNGKALPEGAYYWVFEGINGYYNTKVVKSGLITLIR